MEFWWCGDKYKNEAHSTWGLEPLSAQSFVYNRSRRKIVEFINFVSRHHAVVPPPSTTRKMIFSSCFRAKTYFFFIKISQVQFTTSSTLKKYFLFSSNCYVVFKEGNHCIKSLFPFSFDNLLFSPYLFHYQ